MLHAQTVNLMFFFDMLFIVRDIFRSLQKMAANVASVAAFTIAALNVFLSVPLAADQESEPDNRTCSEVLYGPVLKDALTRNDGKDWGVFVGSRELIGVKCDLKEIDEYFFEAGWQTNGFKERPPGTSTGPFGPSNARYFSDASTGYFYCRPYRTFFFLEKKCPFSIGVNFFEGRVTNIHGGYNK